ncbi:hypothetical protein BT69DRAFT_1353147 [Atractiella rhizophila]|nr:hypothetical protein BT69DRAFT_1353147 [Atractiella rhizophila]
MSSSPNFSLQEIVVCDWEKDQEQYVAIIRKLPSPEENGKNREKYFIRWARYDAQTKEWVQATQRNYAIPVERIHKATPDKLEELREADEEVHREHKAKVDKKSEPPAPLARQDSLRPRQATMPEQARTGRRRREILAATLPETSLPVPSKKTLTLRKRKRSPSTSSTLSTEQTDGASETKRRKESSTRSVDGSQRSPESGFHSLKVNGEPAMTPSKAPQSIPTPIESSPSKAFVSKYTAKVSESVLKTTSKDGEAFLEFPFPESLKLRLIYDWEAVTNRLQLVPLPRKPTVHDIVEQYRNSVRKASHFHTPTVTQRSLESLNDFLQGLEASFNWMLGQSLLYQFERLQFARLHQNKEKLRSSDIYGAEHLLRFWCNIPEFVLRKMDPHFASDWYDYCCDFIRFMRKEQDTFFIKRYQETPGGYQNLARSGL